MTILSTPQTLALARLTGINDTQMSNLRSFLKHIGRAELELKQTEVLRIDNDVGIHKAMPTASHADFVMEWATASGKGGEKKAPEVCNYWNADVLVALR